eukprot:7474364-Pyramimonas_sp.AAC.2
MTGVDEPDAALLGGGGMMAAASQSVPLAAVASQSVPLAAVMQSVPLAVASQSEPLDDGSCQPATATRMLIDEERGGGAADTKDGDDAHSTDDVMDVIDSVVDALMDCNNNNAVTVSCSIQPALTATGADCNMKL